MPEVRRRRVSTSKPPVSRRRDRVEDEEEDIEEEEDTDAAAAPVRKARGTTKKAAARRRPPPVEEEEEEDEEEEDEEEEEAPKARRRRPRPDDEEEDEDEEEAPRTRKKAAAAKKAAPRRRRAAEDDEEEEEEAPRRRRGKKEAAPAGIHGGLAGAEKVRKSGGGGANRLALGKDPELIKVLEPEPVASYRQHWISTGAGQGNLPHVCAEEDCPLCDIGDDPTKVIVFNVLHFPADGPPVNKQLPMGIKAFNAFSDAATPKGKEKPVFDRDYWAVNRSGKGNQSQTNFKPVKDRDLEEDWEEIFDNFDPEDLDAILEEAAEKVYPLSSFAGANRKKLAELARYAADEDE